MLSPVHAELANNITTPNEAAEKFAALSIAHVNHHSVIHPTSRPTQPTPQHRERAVVCLSKRLPTIKNNLRKNFPSHRSVFLNVVRAHKSVKTMNELHYQRTARKEERAFKFNPWKFSKSVCDESNKNTPKFSQLTYLPYFKSSFADSHQIYKGLPDWVAGDALPGN